jgi:hypothetical protein
VARSEAVVAGRRPAKKGLIEARVEDDGEASDPTQPGPSAL